MRRIAFLCLLACLQTTVSYTQCEDYLVKGSQVFHGNDIRTVILTGGDMFWDLNDAQFQVPYRGQETPSAIFAAAVWLGGYDESGNLRLSAQKHRLDRIDFQEYAPGPLLSTGFPLNVDCALWDTIWSVTREEIFLHIEDYALDGVIDNPQRSIFGWPGFKNMSFESVNGFLLPNEPQGYAPFFDADQDAYYEPEDGEYPLPHGLPAFAIPDQITWHVFNDVRTHHVSAGDAIGAEFQQTCYAFYCQDESILNRTLFVDFQIINRSTSTLDSTYFTLWMDPDLGCYTDDFIGCSPSNHSFMAYNRDGTDGNLGGSCDQGVRSYPQGPPVISGSFLNREMSSFMYFFSGAPVPPEMEDPVNPLEFYRLMNAQWRDGTPLTFGGSGYNVFPGGVPTGFAFPGDPNDDGSWAMTNVMSGFLDNRMLASTGIGVFEPGTSARISMAFSLHLDPLRNNLENVTLMYEELPLIKEEFINGFEGCGIATDPCGDDCVWAGDANHDGIANNLDVLDIGIANGNAGPARNAPLSWSPYRSEAWLGTVSGGVNEKHADCDGDGIVEFAKEIDILDLHYGLTHDEYTREYNINTGGELILEGGFELVNPQTFATQTLVSLNPDMIGDLYGIAFTVVYDTQFFSQAYVDAWTPFDEVSSDVWKQQAPGIIEYAAVHLDGQNESVVDKVRATRFFFTIHQAGLVPGQNDTTWVHLANIRGVLNDGTEIEMGANTVRFVFLEETTATTEIRKSLPKVYPNPTSGLVHYEVPFEWLGSPYQVHDSRGLQTLSGQITTIVNSMSLPVGVFVLTINSTQGTCVEKIVVLE